MATQCNIVPLDRILADIKSGKWKLEIHKIRSKKKNGKDVSKDKKRLPGIMFSGTFQKRSARGLKCHSGLLCLDFDGLDETVEESIKKLKEDKYCAAVWISPSGNGIKMLIKIQSDVTKHKELFDSAVRYFSNKYGIDADPSGKDVSRLCFVSYDPELYLNTLAQDFDLESKPHSETRKVPDRADQYFTDSSKLELIAADHRLEELLESNPSLRDLWAIHVSRYFQGGPRKRNAFISEVIPRLFYRLSRSQIRKLSDLYWEAYRDVFKDSLETHRKETESMLSDLETSYPSQLQPGEFQLYSALSAKLQQVFRIVRDLAKHEGIETSGVNRFYLPCNELKKRMGFNHDNDAWRILQQFENYDVIQTTKRGTPRTSGNRGEATQYHWILSPNN